MPKILTLCKVVCCRKWAFVGMDVWFRGSGGRGNGGRMMEDEEKEGDLHVIIFTNVLTPYTKDCVHVTASSALMLQFATDWLCPKSKVQRYVIVLVSLFPCPKSPCSVLFAWEGVTGKNVQEWTLGLFVCFPGTSLLALCACIHTLQYYIHFLNDSYLSVCFCSCYFHDSGVE